MINQVGVWLDRDKAYIVECKEDSEHIFIIESEVEHFNHKGGHGTVLSSASQNATSDTRLLERKKHQLQQYFQDILEQLPSEASLYICGPAETKNGFAREATAQKKRKLIIRDVASADSMTENQLKAKVRTYYNN